ncbi:MAG: hypothetical protein JJU06_01855 [Ectothiorhodospiraceae bacterium]|nr:hypothetical protein [Ectothiorhodospiraceae bacterium]MCH8503435.1 hypothetical protein [Ectothiorhodospiraceae bacterium]
MLLKRTELEAIRSGRVSLVFRRWRKPTVKTGGSLKTSIGVLDILQVTGVERARITEHDAAAAGYESLALLLRQLDSRQGDIYRIEVRFAGADPRLALRENDRLSESELNHLRSKLARLDASSPVGPWTLQVLGLIDRHPRVAAIELAGQAGVEKARLKTNVRKLKNLGLTISHGTGYELSPRGKVVLQYLKHSDRSGER